MAACLRPGVGRPPNEFFLVLLSRLRSETSAAVRPGAGGRRPGNFTPRHAELARTRWRALGPVGRFNKCLRETRRKASRCGQLLTWAFHNGQNREVPPQRPSDPQNQKNRLENRWNAAGTVDSHYLLLVAGADNSHVLFEFF